MTNKTQDWTRMLKSFRTKTYRNLPTDEADRAAAGSTLISSRQSGVGDVDSQRSKLIPVAPSTTTSLFRSFLSVALSLPLSAIQYRIEFRSVVRHCPSDIQRSVRPSVVHHSLYRMDLIEFSCRFSSISFFDLFIYLIYLFLLFFGLFGFGRFHLTSTKSPRTSARRSVCVGECNSVCACDMGSDDSSWTQLTRYTLYLFVSFSSFFHLPTGNGDTQVQGSRSRSHPTGNR